MWKRATAKCKEIPSNNELDQASRRRGHVCFARHGKQLRTVQDEFDLAAVNRVKVSMTLSSSSIVL